MPNLNEKGCKEILTSLNEVLSGLARRRSSLREEISKHEVELSDLTKTEAAIHFSLEMVRSTLQDIEILKETPP